jgi:hypothetical protein
MSLEFGNSNLYISLMKHFADDFIPSQIHDSSAIDVGSDEMKQLDRIKLALKICLSERVVVLSCLKCWLFRQSAICQLP